MRTLTETLSAGQVRRLTITGRFFMLMECIGAVDITFNSGSGGGREECTGIKAGFWYEAPADLTEVSVVSASAQTIAYVCGIGRAGYSRTQLQIEQPTAIAPVAPVATVNAAAATLLIAADATRKAVAFRNDDSNTDRIAIGGLGVTFANAVHILAPGEPYTDDNAGGAAFYAISETNAGQIVRIESRS